MKTVMRGRSRKSKVNLRSHIFTLSNAKTYLGRLVQKASRGELVYIVTGQRRFILQEIHEIEPIPMRPAGYFANVYRHAESDSARVEVIGQAEQVVVRIRDYGKGISPRIARLESSAKLGVGITGIAGPGGGSEEKPVGTVHIALSHAGGVKERGALFPGDREAIRWHASQLALDMVRIHFLYNGGEPPSHGAKRS